jgi:hypothetical protein
MKVVVTGRLEGVMEPAVRGSRHTILMFHQYHWVDARGAPVQHASRSSGGDGRDGLSFSLDYTPNQTSGPPAEFRYHDLDLAAWEIPFEFRDVPLP